MKYIYKISYGGTSSISSSSQIFNAVDELNNLFEIIINQKSNYKDYTDSQFITEFEKNSEDLEYINNKEVLLDNIYNYDKDGEIYKEDKYKIVTDDQLNNLIPKIKDLYLNKFSQMSSNYGNYVLKEYFSEKSKVIYLGDYHSSIHSLIIVIKYLQSINILQENYELIDNYYIVFLGDIVDRGPYGIECLYIIYLLFYINNQEIKKIFVLNGNHEEKNVYQDYGFENEMDEQLDSSKNILEEIIQFLPLALFIKNNDNNNAKWYQFCHGGIDIYQTRDNTIKNFLNSENNFLNNSLNLNYEVNDIIGFLWSDFIDINFLNNELIQNFDPNNDIKNPKIMMIDNSNRPVYNDYQVKKVLDDLNIMTIISGHQDLTNYAFLLRKYPFDNIYFSHGLLTFNDNLSNVNMIEAEQSKYQNKNNISNKEPEIEKDLSVNLDFLNIGGNMNNFIIKSHKIRMETILASVMSSATISKGVPYSVFGILDLQNDESEIVYLKPNFGI